MATYMNNIFNFGRDLPAPFDTLSNKKVGVSSKYGDKTTSTLCATMIKAIHAVINCMQATGEGAVGIIDQRTVAEYKSSVGPDAYHLVVYDSDKGSIMASVYDKGTEVFENYVLNSAGRDGAAVMMALFPVLMTDDEFEENFNAYRDHYTKGFTDFNGARDTMAILCDNAYRRIKDETCTAHVKVNVDKSGNLMRVSQAQMDSGLFAPKTVVAGEFVIMAQTARVTVSKATTLVEHEDFVGKYEFGKRSFSALEQSLIPQLPAWYIIPDEVVDICKHAQLTTGKPMQMRNFLLRGPAGTGKTMGAKAIAAGLNLPYMKYTCSAGTEIFDFVGMIFPDSDSGSTGDAQLDAENAVLKSMGGVNYANVSKLMNLPDLDDMDYDPAGVYKALTGIEKADASTQDCMAIVLDKVTEKVRALSKRDENSKSSGQTYTYVETDFIKALKNGYVIEIQEPSTIVQPGVLVGLMAGEDGDYGEPVALEADIILVDEVSMMDIYLAGRLLEAVKSNAQIVLIGDSDQLPSVGPGAVLSEMIASARIPVVRLDRVFRQTDGSRIAVNAKLIRHGNLSLEYGSDFRFVDSANLSDSANRIAELYMQEVAKYGVDNVALLSPYRQKTETGVNALNELLREMVNPPEAGKQEVTCGKRKFRTGDKVMQIKNYEDVNNGDIGYIRSIYKFGDESTICIDFGDGRTKEYDSSELDMIDLGYASTIHKSQGSEYRSVIINLQCAHHIMLTRPLVYTAITRGKEKVIIVGERRALCIAIKKTDTEKRGTCLAHRLQELA